MMTQMTQIDILYSAWDREKLSICNLMKSNPKEVNADRAGVLAKVFQKKLDVMQNLEDSMHKYHRQNNYKSYYYYTLDRPIEWEFELLRLKRIVNAQKISEEVGQNQAVADEDNIKKTLQELNEKIQICMASVSTTKPASDDDSVNLLSEAVRKIEKLAAEQETMKKTLQDLIEKTGAGTVSAVQKKPIVDEEKVDYVRMRLITDLLQGLVRNSDKKEEEGTMVNVKSLAEVKVKKLLEELKTIPTADLKDDEQKDDNKDGEA